MQYRREIDGLRGVAVLLVMLFHAGLPGVRGGFVGVDVFFVISGYLITGILIAEQHEGTHSLRSFYERRMRRLLPALYVVMGASAVLGYALMMPHALASLGQSMVATTLFANNLLLVKTAGYWDLLTGLKPLVHSWSLGVEEQFYLLYPLVFVALWRGGRSQTLWLLALLGLASLGFAQWAHGHAPQVDFYLLPSRAFELVAGALCAVWSTDRPPLASSAASLVGLSMILGSSFLLGSYGQSPSILSVAPVFGTALVLLFGRGGSLTARILSAPPLVGVGLISYSAYLWHQPLFAFARIWSRAQPPLWVFLALTGVALVLAYLSWRLVERPGRDRTRVPTRRFLAAIGASSVLLIIVGLVLDLTNGLPQRVYDGDVARRATTIAYNKRVFAYKKPHFARDGRVRLLVIGNSFARDFANMMIETIDMRGIQLVYQDDYGACDGAANPVRDLMAESDVVVAGSAFDAAYMPQQRIARDRASAPHFGDAKTGDDAAPREAQSSTVPSVKHNVGEPAHGLCPQDAERLRGRIFFVGPKGFGYNVNWIRRVSPAERLLATNAAPQDVLREDAAMQRSLPPTAFISLMQPILIDGRVPITDAQACPLTWDQRHLTQCGAAYLGQRALRHPSFLRALRLAR